MIENETAGKNLATGIYKQKGRIIRKVSKLLERKSYRENHDSKED